MKFIKAAHHGFCQTMFKIILLISPKELQLQIYEMVGLYNSIIEQVSQGNDIMITSEMYYEQMEPPKPSHLSVLDGGKKDEPQPEIDYGHNYGATDGKKEEVQPEGSNNQETEGPVSETSSEESGGGQD